MTVPARIAEFAGDLTIRRDLHAHPEWGLQEHRTTKIVAQALRRWDVQVTTGIGGTGVVGVLRGDCQAA